MCLQGRKEETQGAQKNKDQHDKINQQTLLYAKLVMLITYFVVKIISMTEAYLKCNNSKWEYCQMKDGVCVNCDRGRASVMRCTNTDYPVCQYQKSKKFPDGICVNCGKVSCSPETVINKIKDDIRLYSDNFELFHDLADVIRENNVQLTTTEIRTICSYWYGQSRPTRKRLDESNELFTILDHANSGLLQPLNVDYNEQMISLGYDLDGDIEQRNEHAD